MTALLVVARALEQKTEKAGLDSLYPDAGPLRRELYPKHIAMFEAGTRHNERCCLGGNRVGKTLSIGGFETALHLTGLYPDWWPGRTFDKPILCWAGGTKSTKVRDVNQKKLLGKLHKVQGATNAQGGLIPARLIGRLTRKSGESDAVDQAVIRHVKGWENLMTLKSYEEGRTSFEAEEVDYLRALGYVED